MRLSSECNYCAYLIVTTGYALLKPFILYSVALFFVASSYTGRPVCADGLMAGVSVINITPPVGLEHGAIGIGGGIDVNKGINDSTYAKILALSDGVERMTVITLDLLAFVPDRVRELLPPDFQNTVFCATHDHMGAATVDFVPPEIIFRTEYLTNIEDAIATAIMETHEHISSVTVGSATGTVDLSYNKLGGGQGLYICGQQNPDHIRFEPVDQEVGVIRFDRQDGTPLAILVNYASHPVIAWVCHKVSAEFPGFMTHYVEEEIGGDAVCFFLQGACGDVQPYESCASSYTKAEEFGEKLARAVLEINSSIVTVPSCEPGLLFESEIIPLGGRDDLEDRTDTSGMIFNAELTVTVINQDIALVSGPGEFYVDYQLDLKERSPLDHTYFLGYSNGYFGYFPTIQAVEEDWDQWYAHNMWVEIGAGDKFIEKGLVYIEEMLPNTTVVAGNPPPVFLNVSNHPNPFNPVTTINYKLNHRGFIDLTIYDIQGRKVTTLVDEMQESGAYSINWYPENCASGLYFCRIVLDRSHVIARKMLLLK